MEQEEPQSSQETDSSPETARSDQEAAEYTQEEPRETLNERRRVLLLQGLITGGRLTRRRRKRFRRGTLFSDLN